MNPLPTVVKPVSRPQSAIERATSFIWFSALSSANAITYQKESQTKLEIMTSADSQQKHSRSNLYSITNSVQSFRGKRLTERDKRECELIESLVGSYFEIVKKTVQDLVPKAIMHCMVNFVKENIQTKLVEILYKSEQDENLLQEPENISMFREQQKFMLNSLRDAEGMINDIRDIFF